MKRLMIHGLLIATACLICADLPMGQATGQQPQLRGLGSLYEITAGCVRDTNGDGLADSVVARVIVPADPAVEDVQAAANIAGRLGFETTALTLPIVLRASDVAHPASIAVP